jgi:opacity protein-like surface antigen
MKRFGGVAAVCLVAILGADVSTARAQSVPAEKMYGEFNFGPTLGHQSSGFFGGDFGYRLTPGLDIVAEVSHMNNVGTSDLDDRATIIANAIGGTSSSAFKVTEFAAGIRYRIPVASRFEPYALAEFGVANVKTEVAFAVNGQPVDPASVGVQLGADLSGTLNKPIFVIGFGVNYAFKSRYFADLGYRFGEIFPNKDAFETDTGIPTQRIIFGVGVRF